MKKHITFLLMSLMVLAIAACSKTENAKQEAENDSSSSENFSEIVTANKWNMIFNEQSYGTILFNNDGTCVKTAEGISVETNGIWKIEGDQITLHFASEGEPFTGSISKDGSNLIVKFMDGAITYTYTPAQ